ncbi:MAG: sulfotransferase [Desulfobacterales bacterium]
MTFNFPLMFRMFFKSMVAYRETGARFTVKRVFFVIFFPVLYFFHELVTWICLLSDEIFFPEYRKVEVGRPLFIVGFPRSGTTYLHRIVDSDVNQFTSLKLWEILFAPSILQKKFFLLTGKFDRLMGKPFYRLAIRLENRIFAGSRSMHKISFFEAEEDEIILIHIFSSLFQAFMFPFDEMNPFSRFDTDVSPAQRKTIMKFYQRCIQRHLYAFGPDKCFLSKNPVSSSKINSIYETFPEAKIVCLVRQPLEAVPSAISFMSYGFRKFNAVDQAVINEKIFSLISHFYTYPLEQLSKRSEDCGIIETYDMLVRDPGAFVTNIYNRFGFDMSESFQSLLDRETRKIKNYSSRHAYSLDEYGLTAEQIVHYFKPIFDRFEFSTG